MRLSWRNINNLLEEAGYKTQSSVESKSNSSLPTELSVKIANICFDYNTGTIDINIRVSLPSASESPETEDRSDDDRT